MTMTLGGTMLEIRSTDGAVRLEVTFPAIPANTEDRSWAGLRWAVRQTLQEAVDWVEVITRDPESEFDLEFIADDAG